MVATETVKPGGRSPDACKDAGMNNGSGVVKRGVLTVAFALALLVAAIVVLWAVPPGFPFHRGSDPDPALNQGVAVDCTTGTGWIGYDGLTHCPTPQP